MERRYDVIYAILFWLRGQHATAARIPVPLETSAETPSDVLRYHIELCQEAGFIRELPNNEGVFRLTWCGHDKLDELAAQRRAGNA